MMGRLTLAVLCALAVVAVAACGEIDRDPTSPKLGQPREFRTPEPALPTRPPIPSGSSSISGIVYAVTAQGAQPLRDADVNAWVQTPGIGFSYWYAHGPVRTDADGGFQLLHLPEDAVVQVTAHKTGLTQQCAAPGVKAGGAHRVDAYLVPMQSLSSSIASVPASPGYRSISGVVYQGVGANRRPAQNVWVSYEPFMEVYAAVTSTDAAGRFLLCGVPQESVVDVSAWLDSRAEYVKVPAGPDAGIAIEFK